MRKLLATGADFELRLQSEYRLFSAFTKDGVLKPGEATFLRLITRTSVVALLISVTVTCLAQSPNQRAPPVLKSTGVYSPGEQQRRQQTSESTNGITADGIVRLNTSLITIPAIVMDRNGRYIANLRKDDFRIYEDGVEQKVSYFASVERPFTVALMLDVSGSTQYQLNQIREAANTFVNRLRFSDRLMAVSFDGQIHVLNEPMEVATIRRSKLHIPAVTDGTVLYDAVDYVLKRMEQIPGRKAIVLLTDGCDQSSRTTLENTLAEIAEQDVLIYTVQYDTLRQLPERLSKIQSDKARRKIKERLLKEYAVSEPYLRALAEKTGGRFYKADDLRDVGPAFEAITQELGVQYSLGYYSGGNAASQRSIKVRVRYPDMAVRARDSYTTSQPIANGAPPVLR